MSARFTLVGLGEALFDIFGPHQRLGGAPLNVAVHAHRLLRQAEVGRAVVVSRIGQDDLGRELLTQLGERGIDAGWIQSDPDRPTGRVYVMTDDEGEVRGYDIADAAWDVLQYDPDLEALASQTDAVAFGSLAQRDAQSRGTIHRFLGEARRAIKLFDVNLRESRGRKFYDRGVIRRSCELATLLKLNHEELPEVAAMLGMEGEDAGAIREALGLEAVVLTLGAEGTVAYTAGGLVRGEPAEARPVEGADSVGAGDSCSAAVLVGRLLGKPWPLTLTLANQVAAHVVGQPGATPELPEELLAKWKM